MWINKTNQYGKRSVIDIIQDAKVSFAETPIRKLFSMCQKQTQIVI